MFDACILCVICADREISTGASLENKREIVIIS